MLAFDKIKEIEVSEFHTSNAEATYLATYGGKYYEINAVVAGVLEIAKQANTIDDAVIRYVEASGNRYTEDDVRKFLDRCMELFDTAEQPKRPFILRFDLVSAEKITWLTRKLAFLFDVRILFPLLAIAAVLDGYFCATDTLLVTAGSIDLYVIIGLLLFIIASSCIHELGHAAACRYYGIEHGNVGFGLYLNFPVFYTDVSNIWRLKREQRCVVNLAGIYFQSIILLPVLVAYFVTGHPVLKYLILLTNINFVITLNPFFRFDGYWLMTDLLGIANLRAKSMELLRYLYYRKSARRVETSIIDGQAGIQVCVVRLFRGGEPVLRILFLLYHPAVYNSFRRIFPRIVPHDARFALIWNNAGFRDYSADRSAASVHGDYGLFPVSDG